MGKFLKFAIGVAVLGVVGLVGLSVMSIVAALVLGRSASHQVVPGVLQVPARTAVVGGIERGVPDVFNVPVETPRSLATEWARPAQVQVNVRESWIDTALSFAGLILLVGMLAILAIVIRSARRGRAATPSEDSLLVHELARRAQEMSQRMESLETILLDRTRTAR